jgi:hypothetical protein
LNIDTVLSYIDKAGAAKDLRRPEVGREALPEITRRAGAVRHRETALWYLLAIVLVLAVVLTLAGASVAIQLGPDGALNIDAAHPNVTMAIPVSVRVDDRALRVAAPGLGIDRAQLDDLQGTLRFPPRWGAFFAANLVFAVCWLGLALWILGLLRSLIGTLRAGRPFAAANASRVRSIGWAVIIGEVVRRLGRVLREPLRDDPLLQPTACNS